MSSSLRDAAKIKSEAQQPTGIRSKYSYALPAKYYQTVFSE